jgi:hypothetical protein
VVLFVHTRARQCSGQNGTLPSMRVTVRHTGKGKQGALGMAKARRDGFRAAKGGSLAGFWARKGESFGSGLRPSGDEVRFSAASRASQR